MKMQKDAMMERDEQSIRADERKRLRDKVEKLQRWEDISDDGIFPNDLEGEWIDRDEVLAIFGEEEKKATLVHHDMDPTLPSKHDRNRDGLD